MEKEEIPAWLDPKNWHDVGRVPTAKDLEYLTRPYDALHDLLLAHEEMLPWAK